MDVAKSFRFVLAGVALSLGAVVIIVFHLMNMVSDEANKQDYLRSKRGIEAAMRAEKEKIAGLLLDNAEWNDAVRYSYGAYNGKWLEDTWGMSTSQDNNYSLFFLIDEADNTIAGYAGGKETGTTLSDLIGDDGKAFLGKIPRDGTRGVFVDIFKTPDGIAVIGASPIVPVDDEISIPAGRARVLVFGKLLNAKAVAGIAEKTIVSDLQFSDTQYTGSTWSDASIRNDAGKTVAYAIWHDKRPGDIIRRSVELPAVAIVAGLIATTLWLMHMAWRAGNGLRQRELQSRIAARSDLLTGLPNRLVLYEFLNELKGRPHHDAALLMIDLDGFKDINDAYGHEIGDRLLKNVSETFRTLLGKRGMLARLGGDEFAIVIADDGARQQAEEIGTSLILALSTAFDIDGRKTSVGASVGLSSFAQSADDVDEFIRQADVAMYQAKTSGRNRLCRYEPVMDAQRNFKLEMASDIRKALEQNQISVIYQPYFDTHSRKIIGVEALARWSHETRGPVDTATFISVAEEFGLIDTLGSRVLERACLDAKYWPDLKVSVNISPAQFKNPDFVDTVLAIVDASGIERRRLELEVTETYLIEHEGRAKAIIDRLHAEGLSIALDDFGTGYSSLGYLRHYKFSKLKLDRSMVSGITESASAQKMFQAAMLLAQSLSLTVTAEGVEDEGEATFLKLMGCDYLQGYLLGKPQLPEQIGMLLPDHDACAQGQFPHRRAGTVPQRP